MSNTTRHRCHARDCVTLLCSLTAAAAGKGELTDSSPRFPTGEEALVAVGARCTHARCDHTHGKESRQRLFLQQGGDFGNPFELRGVRSLAAVGAPRSNIRSCTGAWGFRSCSRFRAMVAARPYEYVSRARCDTSSASRSLAAEAASWFGEHQCDESRSAHAQRGSRDADGGGGGR
ncbi:hypothetical protein HPB51_017570 [Rhipicephalus microplus]|uniref:Uncharacterized protein n=1 Tax=Rhipicephalus microplus TaxID=6941 RepID=A0A9J6F4K2_RHIMP|nr:hypothetical protein HPB51_017570 [Rhipicephalus microplus]